MLLGVFTPFFYVQSFALDSGIAGEELSFYIIAIMNLTSALGRIIPNFFSTRFGPFNMFLVMNLVTFVTAFGFIGVTTLPGLIVTAAIYGFSTGSVFALQPVVVIRLCPDPKLIGTRVGMAFSFLSFALLPSTPIAGALQIRGGFTAVWAWTGATTAIGFVIMSLSRGIKTNWKLLSKA
jgi:MFS family permease